MDAFGASTSPLQLVSARVLKWNANVLCMKGKYSLVAVFVRTRQNVLK